MLKNGTSRFFKSRHKGILFVLALCMAILLMVGGVITAYADTQKAFYVANNGSDSISDSQNDINNPFLTIERARQAVSSLTPSMTGDIIVYIRGGTYYLSDTLNIGDNDSGKNGYTVKYMNYPREIPVISGGVQITSSWTAVSGLSGVYQTTLNGTPRFRQLYINGKRAIRARTPNITDQDEHGVYNEMADGTAYPFKIYSSEAFTANNLNQVEMVWYTDFLSKRGRIDSITTDQNPDHSLVSFLSPEGSFAARLITQANPTYFFENAYEFLDAEGEWYLNTTTNTLYYKLRSGENASSLNAIYPNVTTLINISGTSATNLKNIVFSGLTFCHSNWTAPDSYGYIAQQAGRTLETSGNPPAPGAGDYIPGMIKIKNASYVTFSDNIIEFAGAHGITTFTTTSNLTISENIIRNLSGGGIWIDMDTAPSGDSNSVIENNLVERCGLDYSDAVGIAAARVSNITIQHNTIRKLTYSGISIGYNWETTGYGLTASNVRYNRITETSMLHDDGGPIYSLGNLGTGTSISNNYIAYSKTNNGSNFPKGYGNSGIYLDNGSINKTVSNNVVENSDIITTDMSACYKLENYASDDVGSSNGTLYGSTTFSSTDKKEGLYAMVADGTDNYVEVADLDSLDMGTGDYSIAFWMKRNSSSATNLRLISKAEGANRKGYEIVGSNTGVTVYISDGTTRLNMTANHNGVNAWTHIIVSVIRNQTMKIYIDKVEKASMDISSLSINSISNSRPLRICADSNNSTPSLFWSGMIDDVRIYKKALSKTDISGCSFFTNSSAPLDSRDAQGNTISNNYYNGVIYVDTAMNTLTSNTSFIGQDYPIAAYDIISSAGIQPEYQNEINNNLALHRPAYIVNGTSTVSNESYYATDGDENTFTQSAGIWDLKVDLGGTQTFNKITLKVGTSYSSNYSIKGSADGTNWSNAFVTETTQTNTTRTYSFTEQSYRYIMIDTVDGSGSLYEFEVYCDSKYSHYKLENDANDYEGNSNGVLYGSPAFSSSDKKEGTYAIVTDGINDYVEVSDTDALDMDTGDYSIAFWMKRDSNAAPNLRLISKAEGANRKGYEIVGSNTGITVYIGDGTTRLNMTANHNGVNVWTHIVVSVIRNQTMKIYVDKVEKASINISSLSFNSISNTRSFRIGADSNTATPALFWDGMLDDVRIYKKALTQNEINVMY